MCSPDTPEQKPIQQAPERPARSADRVERRKITNSKGKAKPKGRSALQIALSLGGTNNTNSGAQV